MSREANRPSVLARRSQVRRLRLDLLEARELLTVFSVTSAADSGPGSLRAEISAADLDTSTGSDSINFNIPATTLQTISLNSPLPAITRSVFIDGSTEPYPLSTAVRGLVIDGSHAGAGADGLSLTNGVGSQILNLSIVGFNQGGAGIYLGASSSNNLIEADDLGILPDGQTARANTYGLSINGGGNDIGGSTTPASGNLISGNTQAGVLIVGTAATGNLLVNNKIGTDNTGLSGVGNGVGVILAALNNTVGGLQANQSNIIAGNVGSDGKSGIGVLFEGPSTGNVVDGNDIGVGLVHLTSSTTTTRAVPNACGIYFGSPGTYKASDVVQQDTVYSNIVSGNTSVGIAGVVRSSLIAGNTVGLSGPGTALETPVPNGTGILLNASNTTIGGTTSSTDNVISANTRDGLVLSGGSFNLVEGNLVGLEPFYQLPMGNGGSGIVIGLPSASANATLQSLNDTIGGTAAGAGNLVAYNAGSNILLRGSDPNDTGLTIRGNSTSGNSLPGIDSAGDGVASPPRLFVTSANLTPSGANVFDGIFQGQPNSTYTVDLYGNLAIPQNQTSTFGPRQVYEGAVTVNTDSTGFAVFTPTLPAVGHVAIASFAATLTGPDGDTSEFSTNFPPSASTPRADLAVTSASSSPSVSLGDPLVLTETITNHGSVPAQGVQVYDSLPNALTNIQVSSSLGTASLESGNVASVALDVLNPGQSVTLTISAKTSRVGSFTDVSGASSTTLDPFYGNNETRQTINVVPKTFQARTGQAVATDAVALVPLTDFGGTTDPSSPTSRAARRPTS